MSIDYSALDINSSSIVALAYQKAWSAANDKFSFFSLVVDDFRLISKRGRWIIDGTVVNGNGISYRWRVAAFKLSSDGSVGTALRYLRRVAQ